jgi:hypothetical protein
VRLQIIDGVKTDIIITVYEDRVFIVVTQIKKLGALIQAEVESANLIVPR